MSKYPGASDHLAQQLEQGVPLNAMTRHMLGLFNGKPGARLFRRHLSENATKPGANVQTLRAALAHLAMPARSQAA